MANPSKPQSVENTAADTDRGFFDLPDFGALGRQFAAWVRENPAGAVLFAALLGVVGYYYFGVKAFMSLSQTSAQWIAASWNSWNDQEHCWAIIPGAILLVFLRWRDLEAAPKEPSNSGLWWIAAGIIAFVAGIRCVEGRFTIFALPLLCYGTTRFLFGPYVARIIIFPCLFLLFMTPMGQVVQSTANLQTKTAHFIERAAGLVGLPIYSVGATIYSKTGAFEPLEVAGGCSGIRSLMAMMTLASLYAYYVMRTPSRGVILFSGSIFFALVGNIARVFSVVLVARFISPAAAKSYHDWSGFVFFPVAVLVMVAVGNVLNRDWFSAPSTAEPPKTSAPTAGDAPAATTSAKKREKSSRPASYDY